jgi:DcaP outer membrane protein
MKKLNSLNTWVNLFLCTVLSTSASKADDSISQRISNLEKELNELKSKLNKPGIEIEKGTRFNYGGYIKADAMMNKYSDQNRAGNIGDEILVPSTIAVGDGGAGGDTNVDSHIKTSRFWFKTATQTDVGAVRTHIELDFLTSEGDERISSSAHSRVRQAYLSWDYNDDSSILAGQSWSTFLNVGVLPESIDFIGPTSGTIFMRQNQLRWTKLLGSGRSVMAALENPSTSLYDGGVGVGHNNYDDNSRPDLILRYNATHGKMAYSIAGLVREVAYNDREFEGDEVGYGLSVSGKFVLDNGDDLKWMANYGNLGRYIALHALRDGVLNNDGKLDLVDIFGGFVSYRHFWTQQLRSTLTYAFASADNPSSAGMSVTESVSNTNINLIYSPTQALSFGAEYILADRQLENGLDGELKRLQVSAKFSF